MYPAAEAFNNIFGEMKVLTDQRLAFNRKMREMAPMRQVSPKRNPEKSHLQPGEANASDDDCLQTGVLSVEGRVTYIKLQGDNLQYSAEMAHHDGVSTLECDGIATRALEVYLTAQQAANGSSGRAGALPKLHPMRLELALRISSVLLHLLRRPVEAWEVAYPAYVVASKGPARLGPRGLTVPQLLRDHLACIDVKKVDKAYDGRDGLSGASRVLRPGGAEAEWRFLGMSSSLDRRSGYQAPHDKLWPLVQVKQAQARLDCGTKILLSTMEYADKALSALQGQVWVLWDFIVMIPSKRRGNLSYLFTSTRGVILKANLMFFQRRIGLCSYPRRKLTPSLIL